MHHVLEEICSTLKSILNPFFVLNALLALSYILIRTIEPLCHNIFQTTECQLSWYDSEILFFVIIIVVFKTKKKGATSMLSYCSSLFMYIKIANIALYLMVDAMLCLAYIFACLVHMYFFPEPTYSGPDELVYFNEQNFEEELESDRRITWVIAFYAIWSPKCIDFAPHFAELSAKYNLENLRFGKIDVGRYPKIAEKYKINCSSLSQQLPTVAIFKNARVWDRRPHVDAKCKLIKFVFSKENMIAAFDLNNLYDTCKKTRSKKKNTADEKKTD